MSTTDFQTEIDIACTAALRAGELIRSYLGSVVEVREKGTHELVTRADEEAQNLIIDHLLSAFPEDQVLAEEGAQLAGVGTAPERRRWIVDPLDGTTNFTHGLPPFCVSIALQAEDGELVVGALYEVTLGELYVAARGMGASRNGEPIRVSETRRLDDALVTTGFPFRDYSYLDPYLEVLRRFMVESRGVRRPGSAAADLAYVACGRFDVFFEPDLAPWDVAAGIVLVREAGGTVSGLAPGGDPLFGGQILASNGALHPAVFEITRPLGEFYSGRSADPYDETRSADTHSKASS